MLRTFSFLTLFFIGLSAFGQNRMSSTDMNHLYDLNHEFVIDEQVAKMGTRYKVFLRFRLNSTMVKFSDFEVSYDIRTAYIDEKLIDASVPLDTSYIVHRGFREQTYAIEFETSEEKSLMAIQVNNIVRNRKYLKDISLSSQHSVGFQSFMLYDAETDLPYFEKYVNSGAKLKVKNILGEVKSFSVKGSENNAMVATPPFDDSKREPAESRPLDTVLGVLPDEAFEVNAPGFYEISAGEDASQNMGILVTGAPHPYFEEYSELVKPLIYISTNQEFVGLLGADNPKERFEEFVLSTISSNPNIAQEFVKYYYRRVRKSARLFTTHKEGWKTDRGMVYQVYGNPGSVFRNETTELWVYTSETGSRVRFIFDIMKGPAGTRTFKLIRGKKYRDGWMNAVTRWRSGRIIE